MCCVAVAYAVYLKGIHKLDPALSALLRVCIISILVVVYPLTFTSQLKQ